ncbi:MAG: hypothetical protein ACPL4I_10900 [Bacteroidota bacterium]
MIARTIGERSSIILRDVLRSDIPSSFKTYLRAEVAHYLDEDRSMQPGLRRFRQSDPAVRILKHHLDNALIASFEFSSEEFAALIDTATHFLFNYTLRPIWTMVHFFAEGNELNSAAFNKIQRATIERKCHYLHAYPYLQNALLLYLDSIGATEISPSLLSHFLHDVDREILRRHTADEILKMLSPIFSLFNQGQGKPLEASIPTNAIVVFFEDKERYDIHNHFEMIRDEFSRATLSPAELYTELLNFFEAPEHPLMSSSIEPRPSLGATPLPGRNEEGISEPSVPMESTPHSAPEPDLIDTTNLNTSQIASTSAETPYTLLRPIESFLSPRELKKIVKKIFRRDEGAFRQFLSDVNNASSAHEAISVLDDMLIKMKVHPNSKYAKRLLEVIYLQHAS